MSSTLKQALQSLKSRIADAYTAIVAKGGTLPATQDSANLPAAIASIPTGGGDHIPEEYTQLQYADLVSNAALNSGLNFGAINCKRIEITMSGEPDYNMKAVIASGVGNTWWIAWIGTQDLRSQAITFTQGTPSYTYSDFFDGNVHTIKLNISSTSGALIRFFGFQDVSYNRPRRFYDIKMYSASTTEDVLISHLYPVKRDIDGAIGFYDSIAQVFYDYSAYLSE